MTVTDREKFLLGVIAWLDDQDYWYLEQCPDWRKRLEEEFGWCRP